MRLDLTLIQINAIKAMLADAGCEDDGEILLSALEGETDAFEMVRKLLNGIEADEGDIASLTEQMAARKARRDRCEARVDQRRLAIMAIMECAGLDKLPLPEATLTKRMLAAKLAVNDPAAVPEEYTGPAPKPDMDKIKAAFDPANDALPNWLRVEPERPSLIVRRK
jgi:hypothetical protein